MRVARFGVWLSALVALGMARPILGETPALPEAPLPNLEAPTLGGKQVWGDIHVFHDWRVQRNSLTGHCRLLDGHDVRLAWGIEADCRARLADLQAERGLPAMKGRA